VWAATGEVFSGISGMTEEGVLKFDVEVEVEAAEGGVCSVTYGMLSNSTGCWAGCCWAGC
jgi:hypothetical protein